MDRNNGGDPLAPPRPPKSQQPRVHQLSHPHPHQPSSSSLHHRPRAPEPLPSVSIMSSSSSSSSSSDQPPPRPPAHHSQPQTAEPVLPLPPRAPKQPQHPLKPTVLHATSSQSAPAAAVAVSQAPTIAPLVPLQQQPQQTSITFGRRPVQPQPASSSLSSRGGGSPSPSRTFNPIGGGHQSPASPIISSLTRNITNLSSHLISNLVSSHSSPSAAAPADTVTLALPRPENERLTNEYVDTPFLQQQQQRLGGAQPLLLQPHPQQHSTTTAQLSLRQTTPHAASRTNGSGPGVVTSQPTAGGHGPTARLLSDSAAHGSPHALRKLGRQPSHAAHGQVITKQPTSTTPSKDLKDSAALHSIDKLDSAELSAHLIDGGVMGAAATGHAGLGGGLLGNGTPSITCPQCEKCRCEGCQKPRQLPSRWLCGKSCLCSAESVLDYATCLCCVKAIFYHCSKDHEIDNENGNSISCADDPCSCLPHRRTTRWGCLGALSLCLPCLACYWPMRGCISLCAACYASHSRKGCRCNTSASSNANGHAKSRQHLPLQAQSQMFGRDGPLRGSGVARREGGVGGGLVPGGPKKVFPVDQHPHQKLAENGRGKQADCDRAAVDELEQDRLNVSVGGITVTTLLSDSDSASSCGGSGGAGGNLVRTLRLKPTSTSSTSSSQLSLLRHPADEAPPRNLLD